MLDITKLFCWITFVVSLCQLLWQNWLLGLTIATGVVVVVSLISAATDKD